MRTHRLAAAIASLSLLATPAVAVAVPADMQYPRPVPPTTGPTPSDSAQPRSTGPRTYDTAATSRVVKPERTIVHNTNDELPLVLAGLALAIAVGGAGYVLIRTRPIVAGR
jgi:hypothetical protein